MISPKFIFLSKVDFPFHLGTKIEVSKDRLQNGGSEAINSAGRSKENVWEEVVAVSENSWEDFKLEALRYKALLEKDVVRAIEKGNKNILRYLVNRIYRIRKSVKVDVLQKVSEGDSKADESALRTLLLCKWEGPIVKFLDKERQTRMFEGEKEHIRFIANNLDWIDPNVQAMAMEGDNEGIRMASNQIHYKSLRNLKGDEYCDDFNMKLYARALAAHKLEDNSGKVKESDNGWTLVENRKKKAKSGDKEKIHPLPTAFTIFLAKIPTRAKASEIWTFFSRMGRILDIILPRKRDRFGNRFGNRFGFVKTDDEVVTEKIIRNLKTTPLLGSLLDFRFMGEHKKSSLVPMWEIETVKADIKTSIVRKERAEGKKMERMVTQKNQELVDRNAVWKIIKDHRKGVKNLGKSGSYDDSISAKKALRNETGKLCKEGVLNKNLLELEISGLIGFSWFPMTGIILQEVLIEEGFSNILVKEISCWKFLLSFKDSNDKGLFDKSRVKHWLHDIRSFEEEDRRIRRKVVVEVRGIPFIAWSESTLMEITKHIGDWGWWINEAEENKVLENPKVCIYSDELLSIAIRSSISVEGVGYEVGIVEIPFDFLKVNSSPRSLRDDSDASKIEKDKVLNQEVQNSACQKDSGGNYKESVEVQECRFGEDSIQSIGSTSRSDLVWDFPKSIDKNNSIIDTGDFADHGDSQRTLCQMLGKVKIKGPGRPKKRKIGKNPFEIGRCKFWPLTRKGLVHGISKGSSQKGEGDGKQTIRTSEAELILESALDIGLILKEDKERTLDIIKDHLAKGQI
ncbi:hypothetical protein POM88_000350 [Heracleum sosnowskyi]|uniref:RRM domain-containing protein n=1 Tax=Heracleum sosnowskyi TaxID=360622 RepID=A0AAD8JA66_9APIA|nr:hypothetical protein POM88_000350 [Heracleum sosnowskyi]